MMKLLLLIVCSAIGAFSASDIKLSEGEYTYLFEQFNHDHARTYSDEGLKAHKFTIFKDNVDFINHHNKYLADELGYTVGINQFADLTNAEFKRMYTGLNALSKPKFVVEHLDESETVNSIDWSAKGAVTPVKNQGQCGSCWAFSTTGSLEGGNFIKSGKLVSLSEQELVSCAGSFGNQGCNGGLMDDGFKFVEKNGLDKEATYGYGGKTGKCDQSKVKIADGIKPGAVKSFKDVKPNSETQLAAAVTKAPVSVAIEADQSGFQFYKSGVFSGNCGTNLDHGVLAVGFGSVGGKAYWKVKNSWGSTWGDSGYILLAKDVKSKSGQCGIAKQPSYPVFA